LLNELPARNYWLIKFSSIEVVKSEVIAEVARRTGIGRSDVRLTVEVLFQTIKSAMKEGARVDFRGFGSFSNKKRARKVARNIAKNTALIIEEHYVPSFNPSKAFVEEIR